MFTSNSRLQSLAKLILYALIILGIYGRFFEITKDQFFYYDEGYYLNFNRPMMEMIEKNGPLPGADFGPGLEVMFKGALGSNKFLWYFLLGLRVFWGGTHFWILAKILSAVFGSLTLWLVYVLVKRLYGSSWGALLTTAFLSILPSHVYYSRLGLQEALSTFLFTAGLYFYLFPRRLHGKTFFSAVLLAGVYLTNYRMIILPFFAACVEWLVSLDQKRKFDFRKYTWHTLTFLWIVFGVGAFYKGLNTVTTFSWMSYQKYLSQGHFDGFSLLSYPFYLFRLETFIFGALFFANIIFILRREWKKALPFLLVLTAMAIFSFPQEKAVRYLCFLMPCMVIAVINLFTFLYQKYSSLRWLWITFIVVMGLEQILSAQQIIHFKSDYKTSMMGLLNQDNNAKVISTQALVQVLYTSYDNVIECPFYYRQLKLLNKYGFNYLVIDPQAYISYTRDKARFSVELLDFLDFILKALPSEKTYLHFSPRLLERFVFEHSENLKNSLAFLKANQDGHLGLLYVYDVRKCIYTIEHGNKRQE